MSSPVYLDFNATTPVAPEVLEAMLPYLRDHFGNPSSAHWLGRRAAEAVAEARERVVALLGARSGEIVLGVPSCQGSPPALLRTRNGLQHVAAQYWASSRSVGKATGDPELLRPRAAARRV
jgi:cysteine desulfurase